MSRESRLYFRDRSEAGERLAERLVHESLAAPAVVLALPRGGVPVGIEVAAALGAELDVFVVRKLGAPFNPELAVGAIASGGVVVYNRDLLDELGLDEANLEAVRRREQIELERRERAYRGGRAAAAVAGRSAILVDDGIATGATMEAAARAVRALRPTEVVVAVPTAAADAVARLKVVADRVVALSTPEPYVAVGSWYEYFPQLSDADVVSALDGAARAARDKGRGAPRRDV